MLRWAESGPQLTYIIPVKRSLIQKAAKLSLLVRREESPTIDSEQESLGLIEDGWMGGGRRGWASGPSSRASCPPNMPMNSTCAVSGHTSELPWKPDPVCHWPSFWFQTCAARGLCDRGWRRGQAAHSCVSGRDAPCFPLFFFKLLINSPLPKLT